MLGKKKRLMLIPAILLIPIMLGMTPLTVANRLASGTPFSHCKEVRCYNHCPFHSITSHEDLPTGLLDSTSLDRDLVHSHDTRIPVFFTIDFSTCLNFNSIPCSVNNYQGKSPRRLVFEVSTIRCVGDNSQNGAKPLR